MLSDIGLNIREAHVFSTTDGYSLDVFVVDGWHEEVGFYLQICLPVTCLFLIPNYDCILRNHEKCMNEELI